MNQLLMPFPLRQYGAGNWLNIMEDAEFKKAFPLRNTSTNAYLRDRWKTLARRGNEPPTVAELEEAEKQLGPDNFNYLGWVNDQREKMRKQKLLAKSGLSSVNQGIPSVDPNEKNIPQELGRVTHSFPPETRRLLSPSLNLTPPPLAVKEFTHRDNRIVWFPTPPLNIEWPQPLAHSAAYLAKKAEEEKSGAAAAQDRREEEEAAKLTAEIARSRDRRLLTELQGSAFVSPLSPPQQGI